MAQKNLGGAHLLAALVLTLLAGMLPGAAWSGSFSITPVRIYMTPQDRATAITVSNDGDTELVMQAELFLWKQSKDGKDELTPTEDVFLTPPIIKLEPRGRQVVRLVRLVPPSPDEQMTYRMFVREIPEALKENKTVQVQLALAFNIPIFITPPSAKPSFECGIQRTAADVATATCSNKGNAHIHAVKFVLSDTRGTVLASEEVGGYLLADVTRRFELKRKEGAIPAGPGKLDVSFADGSSKQFDVDLAK